MDHRFLFAIGVVPIILAFTSKSAAGTVVMLLIAAAIIGWGWHSMEGCIGGWVEGMPRLCR
jgi:hypothetical protein